MGFFRRLFGLPGNDLVDNLKASIGRNATLAFAPRDEQLWRQAEQQKGHISLKAISDEYERLILAKHNRR
jgi:hypothetical protein